MVENFLKLNKESINHMNSFNNNKKKQKKENKKDERECLYDLHMNIIIVFIKAHLVSTYKQAIMNTKNRYICIYSRVATKNEIERAFGSCFSRSPSHSPPHF